MAGPARRNRALAEAADAHGITELVLAIGVPGVDLRARVDELASVAAALGHA